MEKEEFLRWLIGRLADVREELVEKVIGSASPVDVGELKGVIRVINILVELLNSQEE